MDASADSIRVVGEADLLQIARLARSTWKNWCARGLLRDAPDGLYGENAVVATVVGSMLVEALDLRRGIAVWGRAQDRVVADLLALPLEDERHFDLIVDLHTWEVATARTPEETYAVIHEELTFPRGYVLLPLAPIVREARRAFWARALPATDLAQDRRRKTGRKGAKGATGS